MTELPEEFDGTQQFILKAVLATRAQALLYAPMKGDDRHWFLALAEDLKTALTEAGVPVSVMDAQDAKYMGD